MNINFPVIREVDCPQLFGIGLQSFARIDAVGWFVGFSDFP